MVWYSHFLKNFPQFVVSHIVKGFSIINEAEIDVSLEFPCFFYDPVDVGDLISGSSPFLNPTWEAVLRWQRNRTGRPLSPPTKSSKEHLNTEEIPQNNF